MSGFALFCEKRLQHKVNNHPKKQNKQIYHARSVNRWEDLGKARPFHRFTNPRRDKSVNFWTWSSYSMSICIKSLSVQMFCQQPEELLMPFSVLIWMILNAYCIGLLTHVNFIRINVALPRVYDGVYHIVASVEIITTLFRWTRRRFTAATRHNDCRCDL